MAEDTSDPSQSAKEDEKADHAAYDRLPIWLIVATFAVLVIAIALFAWSDNEQSAAVVATYVSGFASALAFLWLVAGFRLQSKELSLQRNELYFQRVALNQQARELTKSARLSSMSEVGSILRGAEEVVKNSAQYTDISELVQVWMEGLKLWKDIHGSKDVNIVFDGFTKWMK